MCLSSTTAIALEGTRKGKVHASSDGRKAERIMPVRRQGRPTPLMSELSGPCPAMLLRLKV